MSDDVKHSLIWGTVVVTVISSIVWGIVVYNLYVPQRSESEIMAKTLQECAYTEERRGSSFCMSLVDRLTKKKAETANAPAP